ncbi:MAG: hypothetical protein IKP44_02415 [Bacteroidaceae bacterium]|nr:hypothetical protein [Bacteroidaceae bacterium]
MKKIYQAPIIKLREMAECIMNNGSSQTPNGKVTVNRDAAAAIDAGSVGVKNEAWDDWDE